MQVLQRSPNRVSHESTPDRCRYMTLSIRHTPSSAPDENNAPSIGGPLGGGGGRGLRRGGASVKWRSSGSDGETTTATAVEAPNLEAAHSGASTLSTVPTSETVTGDFLGVPELATTGGVMTAMPSTPMTKRKGSKWDAVGTGDAEIFLSSYGTVVIWGTV